MASLTTSFVKISNLCPYRFHLDGVGAFEVQSYPAWYTPRLYRHLAHWGGNVYFQFMCLNSALEIGGSTGAYCRIVDNAGATVATMTIEKMASIFTIEGYTVFCVHGNWPLAIANFADGTYFLKLTIPISSGEYQTLYSEPFYVRSAHDDSLKIGYEHDENDFDVIWTDERSQQMEIELVGGLKPEDVTPGGKFTVYSDLQQIPVMLNAQPYNTYRFTFGGSEGIPNWLIDKLNRALSCDKFYINDEQFCRADGAKWERTGEDGYNLAGWSIELMKSNGDSSQEFNAAGISDYGYWTDEGVWKDSDTWVDESIK